MRKKLAILAAAATAALAGGAGPAPIAFPEGFRSWTHVGSSLVGSASPAAPKYEGLHHIYANAAAVEGLKSGRFADGAVLVYDQWSAAHGAGDATVARERKFIDVMVKDSRRFAATDGWGYTEFEAPGWTRVAAIEADSRRACHACHTSQAARDYVFSRWRD